MPRMRLLIALSASLLMAFTTAVTADTLLFDYLGFDYESPDPNPAAFGEPGSGYIGIGTVPGLFAPLTADTTTFQYTYMVSGLTQVSTQAFGTYVIVDYSPGTLSIYEDAKIGGTGADYGNFPPNATAPTSFTDGTLFLTGTLNSFQFVQLGHQHRQLQCELHHHGRLADRELPDQPARRLDVRRSQW